MNGETAVRFGVIGLGVGASLARALHTIPEAEVTWVCDLDLDKAKDVSKSLGGVNTTDDSSYLLAQDDVDAVVIASFDQDHYGQVIQALRNDKHVFVEKPLCTSRSQLESIQDELRSHPNIKISSNLVLRKNPRFLDLRNRIKAGELGEVYYLEGDYDYGRLNKLTHGWRGLSPGYSVFAGGGVHLLDLVLWLANSKAAQAFAMGSKISTRSTPFPGVDFVLASLLLGNDAVAKITANFGSVTPHFHRLTVYGTKATFVQTHTGSAYISSRDTDETFEVLSPPSLTTPKGALLPGFVRSIISGAEPEVDWDSLLHLMDSIFAVEESLSSGKPTQVPRLDANK